MDCLNNSLKMKPILILCQIFIGYIIGVTSVYACERIPFEDCRKILPYNTTTYPNYKGHTSAADSVSLYTGAFGIYHVMGCHKLLVFFVCTYVAPKCNATSGMKIPPCRELCYSVRGPCMGQPDVECSQFPLATENPNCISAKMAELPMTPTPIVTTIPIVTTTVTAPWTKKTTSGPVQDQTTPGPTEVSKSSATTVTNHPKMISPSSETSENTVTYRTEGVEPNINEETIPKEKSYESSAGIILGVSVGTLITMVTLVSMCVCCRFYTQRKSPHARGGPAPETYGGFYANPAFENTNTNDFFTQPAANGQNQGGAVVNSSQTNTQIAAELAITQLPPHPASRPLHTLPVCAPGPHINGTSSLDQAPGPNKTSVEPHSNHLNPYHQPTQRRNTLPANSSPVSSCSSSHAKIPDTAKDVPLSLKAGTLPPEKVIANTGSSPYQELGGVRSVPHYCTLNRKLANSKKSPKRFSSSGFPWSRNSSKSGRDNASNPSSSPKGTPTTFQDPAQDLVFANPAAKDEDCKKNGVMTEINLNDADAQSTIIQAKQEGDNRHGDYRIDLDKEKMVENSSPVIANMSDNK